MSCISVETTYIVEVCYGIQYARLHGLGSRYRCRRTGALAVAISHLRLQLWRSRLQLSTTRPLATISIVGWIRVYQGGDFSWDCVSLNRDLVISFAINCRWCGCWLTEYHINCIYKSRPSNV
jgi:hypothetical protein